MASPLISIILPVYNGVETIGRALGSIQGQVDRQWELIVLDDGSTDGTLGVLQGIAAKDSRIRVIASPHRGLIPTLREGCDLAQGAWLARMDGDDEALPERLSAQRAFLEAHPEVALCGTQVIMAGEMVGPGRRRYAGWLNQLVSEDAVRRDLFIECPIAHPTFLMRRGAYEAVGGYRDYDGPEDYDLVFRFWHGGFGLGNVARPLLKWFERPGRLSMASPRYEAAAFRRLKRAWMATSRLAAGRPVYQWGAGEVGKRWLREWSPGEIEAVVDIRPSKIGQQIHGHLVIAPDALPAPGVCFFWVAVGTPGARSIIRERCRVAGYRECEDYRFIA